jgi:hypothetical protein
MPIRQISSAVVYLVELIMALWVIGLAI